MTGTYLIYTTVPDLATAREIAAAMVAQKLAACTNILPQHESVYWWQGEVVNRPEEHVVIFKTTAEKHDALEQAFIAAHPYDVPCFVSLPIENGHAPFLAWIQSETA